MLFRSHVVSGVVGGGRRCVRDWKGSGVGRLYGGVSGLSGDVGGCDRMRLSDVWVWLGDRITEGCGSVVCRGMGGDRVLQLLSVLLCYR